MMFSFMCGVCDLIMTLPLFIMQKKYCVNDAWLVYAVELYHHVNG
jgi:hypothetical protein